MVFQRSSCPCSPIFILFWYISCIRTGFTCILCWSSSSGFVGCSISVTGIPWSNPVNLRRSDDRCSFTGYVTVSGNQKHYSTPGLENCSSRMVESVSGDINRVICLLCNRSSRVTHPVITNCLTNLRYHANLPCLCCNFYSAQLCGNFMHSYGREEDCNTRFRTRRIIIT